MPNQPDSTANKVESPILFMGDTALDGAASYLAGMITLKGWSFEYIPSDQFPSLRQLEASRSLFILSDFMSRQLDEKAQRTILGQVDNGSGLLMLGGWESFCGMGGDWAGTPIASALPVEISAKDDRINFDQVALLSSLEPDHPILNGLPWDDCPPAIGGFNRFAAKPSSQTLVEVVRHEVSRQKGNFVLKKADTDPLLVTGKFGTGRTAALATDLAPHWVGPLVDWGTQNSPNPSGGGRVRGHAEGAEEVEVGIHYARFVQQLLAWTGNLE